MKYISTRGHPQKLTFLQAIQAGIAPDGGLYMPEAFPMLPSDWETTWSQLSFPELAANLLHLFISETELSFFTLSQLAFQAFQSFECPKVVTPLITFNDHLHVLELFHGPTYAFKDIALQFIGALIQHLGVHAGITVLGATSGDTGSAAIYAFKDVPQVRVCILHPKGKISKIQEAQMVTVLNKNICNVAVNGNFDDCQRLVKQAFAKEKLATPLIPINSINIARILVQMTYYFYAYLHLPSTSHVPIFSVPSGNFGDALAGYFAKRLGLPMHRLIVATNTNNVLDVFLKTGWYRVQQVHSTLAPAMDISVASNFERALYLWASSPFQVQIYMKELETQGAFQVSSDILEKAKQDLWSDTVSDTEVLKAIESAFTSYRYILDPHTAIGWVASHRYPFISSSSSFQSIVLSTAHPGKFAPAVHQATHLPVSAILPSSLLSLLQLDQRLYTLQHTSLEGLIHEVLDKKDWPIAPITSVVPQPKKKHVLEKESGVEE